MTVGIDIAEAAHGEGGGCESCRRRRLDLSQVGGRAQDERASIRTQSGDGRISSSFACRVWLQSRSHSRTIGSQSAANKPQVAALLSNPWGRREMPSIAAVRTGRYNRASRLRFGSGPDAP